MIAAVAQRKADAVAGADAAPGEVRGVARDPARRRRVAERDLAFDDGRMVRPCGCVTEQNGGKIHRQSAPARGFS